MSRPGTVGWLVATLLATVACSDPIDGHWDLVRVGDVEFPLEYTDVEGCAASDALGLEIELGADPPLEAFEIHDSAPCDVFEVAGHDGSVRVEDRGQRYELDVYGWGPGGALELTCKLDEDDLRCQAVGSGEDYEFVR